MKKQIIIICTNCKKECSKDASEVKRNEKLGRNSFCSGFCAKSASNKIRYNRGEDFCKNLKRGSNLDQYSPFRFYLKCIRQRHKNHKFAETNITLEYLSELWELLNSPIILNIIFPK